MVNGGEEFAHITLQKVVMTTGKILSTVNGPVSALADPVGIRVVDETRFPDGFDDPAKGMKHDPVAKWSRRDQAAFGFVDVEAVIRARVVGFGAQFVLQRKQFFFLYLLEGRGGRFAAFPLTGFAISQVQVLEIPDFGVEVAICFHNLNIVQDSYQDGDKGIISSSRELE